MMEVNLLCVTPLLSLYSLDKYRPEAAKYFLVQALGSVWLFMFSTLRYSVETGGLA